LHSTYSLTLLKKKIRPSKKSGNERTKEGEEEGKKQEEEGEGEGRKTKGTKGGGSEKGRRDSGVYLHTRAVGQTKLNYNVGFGQIDTLISDRRE
jgi:hypothetical protein